MRTRARAIAELCNQEQVYNATCAALAERRGCELWTVDKAFYNAVKGTLSFVMFIGDY